MPIHPLVNELQKLRESSKHAVADGNSYNLDEFKEYLHIEREVESKLKKVITENAHIPGASLIMICGNVGDGKSHTLSRLNNELKADISAFNIHNDATESHNPTETSNDTLNRVLDGFSDAKIDSSNEKCILAINLGTLSKFLEEHGDNFSRLKEYVETNKILDIEIVKESDLTKESPFQHVNFTDFHMYALTEEGPISAIISTLLEKLTSSDSRNSLYKAYNEINSELRCPVKYNFHFISIKENQDTIMNLIIQAIVKNKTIVSVRSLLNFFYDLLVPVDLPWNDLIAYNKYVNKLTPEEFTDKIIPNYLFEHEELSSLFESIKVVDPCIHRYSALDKKIVELISSETPLKVYNETLDSISVSPLEKEISSLKNASLTKLFIRLNYFSENIKELHLNDPVFNEYMKELFYFNNNSKMGYQRIYSLAKESIRKWYGDPQINKKVVLRIGRNQSKYRVFKNFTTNPVKLIKAELNSIKISQFQDEISVSFKIAQRGDITIHIDFGLYELLTRIKNGYRPNRKDNNNYYSFVGIINQIIAQNGNDKTLDIDEVNMGDKSDFQLTENDFGGFKFSRV